MNEELELDLLIIRNIADLEASISRAKEIGQIIISKAVDVMQTFAEEKGWFFLPRAEGDINVKFGLREWQMKDGKPDFWFCLGETSASDECDETWLAEFLGAGPNAASIELLFDQRLITEAQMRKLLNSEPDALAALESHGFKHEYGYVKTPLTLEIEAIAKAFEQDDFDAALLPLRRRLEAAAESISSFEEVASLVRARASVV